MRTASYLFLALAAYGSPAPAQSASAVPPPSVQEIELRTIRADKPRLVLECGFVSTRRPDGKPGRLCPYRLRGIEGLSDEEAIAQCRPLAESLHAQAVTYTTGGTVHALSPNERLNIDENCREFVRVARLGSAAR